jgi:hypothetical protein
MIPETVELIGRRNAPFIEEYVFTVDNTPVDFTGCTATMQLRVYANAPDPALVTLNAVSSDVEGVWISDPVNGIIQVRIDEATLFGLPTRVSTDARSAFAYDLRLTWPDGVRDVLMEGAFIVKAGTTR